MTLDRDQSLTKPLDSLRVSDLCRLSAGIRDASDDDVRRALEDVTQEIIVRHARVLDEREALTR